MTELRKLFIEGEVSGETVKVTNGGLDVNIQDQNTRSLDEQFARSIATPTTLSVATAVDDMTITLTSTTGFVDGTLIQINSGTGLFFRAHQIGAPAGSVITLDTPVDKIYSIGSTVLGLSHDMAVDGSVTPVAFQFGPIGSSIEVDITRILAYIQDGTSMDDGRFGGATALTNGLVFRVYRDASSHYDQLWNVKKNGDMALLGYDFAYADKAPGGSYGARWRLTYGGQSKHGVTIRLAASDFLELLVQDDLTVLEELEFLGQGHYVE